MHDLRSHISLSSSFPPASISDQTTSSAGPSTTRSKSSTEESGPLHVPSKANSQSSLRTSGKGSPPLPSLTPRDTCSPKSPVPSDQSDYVSAAEDTTPKLSRNPPSFSRPIPKPALQQSRARGATRSASKGGGVQVVLDGTGSWTELANQSATIPVDGLEGIGGARARPTGMLAFLGRKKGRDKSPKPTERGVLGKEGARVVIS